MAEISMRKGLIEFLEVNSRWNLANKVLDFEKEYLSYKENSELNGRVTLITLDNIEIDVSFIA